MHWGSNDDSALLFYRQSLKITEHEGFDNLTMGLYNNIASVYHIHDHYEDAAKYYYKSINIAEKHIRPEDWTSLEPNEYCASLMNTYNNVGEVLFRVKQYSKSLYYLKKGEGLARVKNQPENMAALLMNKEWS